MSPQPAARIRFREVRIIVVGQTLVVKVSWVIS